MADIILVEGNNELNVGLVPIPPPVANLYGKVTDAQTGYPISGVKVTIDGLVTYTDSIGQYMFSGLSPGSYLMTLEKEGYETLSGTVTIVAGDNEINTEMTLIPALMANLYGVVTDANTGFPLPSVKVTLATLTEVIAQTYTDANGEYRLEGFPPGEYTVFFEKEGYETGFIFPIMLYEGDNTLNMQLVPILPPVANLYGVVTDAETGSPLSGVKVTIDSLITNTDAGGNYGFTGLSPGSYTITFEKDGYETLVR